MLILIHASEQDVDGAAPAYLVRNEFRPEVAPIDLDAEIGPLDFSQFDADIAADFSELSGTTLRTQIDWLTEFYSDFLYITIDTDTKQYTVFEAFALNF